MESTKEFWVECNVCKQQLKNWTGSTPCCGSLAYIIDENGGKTQKVSLYVAMGSEQLKATTIDFGSRQAYLDSKKD